MIGLWIFRAYKHGRTGNYPQDKKPFLVRIFISFDALDNFKDKASIKYRNSGMYPDYCIEYDKIFGTTYDSINGERVRWWNKKRLMKKYYGEDND